MRDTQEMTFLANIKTIVAYNNWLKLKENVTKFQYGFHILEI